MGHAMVRPAVGSIFAEERRRLARPTGRILFANSDLSAISIFEEAQYHGVEAAQVVLNHLSHRNWTISPETFLRSSTPIKGLFLMTVK
jgi:hypothetical protein